METTTAGYSVKCDPPSCSFLADLVEKHGLTNNGEKLSSVSFPDRINPTRLCKKTNGIVPLGMTMDA